MPARPPGEPFADQRCLASSVVVHDQVAVEIAGHAGSDLVEALAEPCGAAARIAFADDAAGGDVEGDEQGARPMALVVVGHPRSRPRPIGAMGWERSSACTVTSHRRKAREHCVAAGAASYASVAETATGVIAYLG